MLQVWLLADGWMPSQNYTIPSPIYFLGKYEHVDWLMSHLLWRSNPRYNVLYKLMLTCSLRVGSSFSGRSPTAIYFLRKCWHIDWGVLNNPCWTKLQYDVFSTYMLAHWMVDGPSTPRYSALVWSIFWETSLVSVGLSAYWGRSILIGRWLVHKRFQT